MAYQVCKLTNENYFFQYFYLNKFTIQHCRRQSNCLGKPHSAGNVSSNSCDSTGTRLLEQFSAGWLAIFPMPLEVIFQSWKEPSRIRRDAEKSRKCSQWPNNCSIIKSILMDSHSINRRSERTKFSSILENEDLPLRGSFSINPFPSENVLNYRKMWTFDKTLSLQAYRSFAKVSVALFPSLKQNLMLHLCSKLMTPVSSNSYRMRITCSPAAPSSPASSVCPDRTLHYQFYDLISRPRRILDVLEFSF